MSTESDVPSVIDGLPGRDRFKLLPMSEDPDGPKDLNVEVWHLMQDSNLEEIFGKDKDKQRGLLIPDKKIKELHKALEETGHMQDYSMIFLFNSHGRYKVREVRRATGMSTVCEDHSISKNNWILSSQKYVLVVPKL